MANTATTATDELRRMLDERGVEHYDGTENTLWGYESTSEFTGAYRFAADEISRGRMQLHMFNITPEQAIDATLGRGTCRNVGYYIDGTRFKCSACGFNGWTKYAADGNDRVPNYCPDCGRKVVDE